MGRASSFKPPVIDRRGERSSLCNGSASGEGEAVCNGSATNLTNTIIKAAVHDLKRNEGTLSVQLGSADLVVTPTIQRMIDELHDLYAKRATKAFGRFSEDANNFPTEGYLKAYLDAGAEGDFGAMTRLMMTTLRTRAAAKPNAGAGHVFFAHVENDKGPFLLIAILNDRLGAALTSTYEVRDAEHLDLDGFRFAGRIGIRGWRAGEKRYIGFLKGRGDIAEYFREFLGCDATMRSKEETDVFVKALTEFVESGEMAGAERTRFLDRAKEICSGPARGRTAIDFTALANELVPDGPERLIEFLSDPDRGLSDGFTPNAGVLGTLSKYKGGTPLWSISFERAALGRDIVYDHEARTLLVRNLPSDLLRDLRLEVPDVG